MSHRHFVVLCTLTIGIVLLASIGAAAQTKPYTPPKTPDGQPDLQGIWSTLTSVPLERPANLGAKEFYTPEEMAAQAQRGARGGQRGAAAAETGDLAVHYDTSQFGLDRSHATVATSNRTSLIVGPEGRVPALLPEAQKRQAARAAYQREHQWDGPDSRPLAERCIIWPSEGPPMLAPGYNSNLQIVQGPGYVAILQEMIHDVRVIPTDGRPHLPSNIHLYFGDSRGHWEGNTLVVDTTNFTDKTAFRGSGEKLHVVERFTRTSANSIKYEFTVDDPTAWAKPWSAEVNWVTEAGPIFEYACQEGNYGMANNLSGARATEKKAAEAAAKKAQQ
ncbi:MAG TPA: hypothetical protein VKY31_14775 [Terriglobia bacterium]|nr:hypothetical protein [Terriglobia bacterium]